MAKQPAMLFYIGDWKKDPAVSLCSPATRGIWVDFLCAMHELDRSGVLVGTHQQLLRLGRCSATELDQALDELSTSGAADITKNNKTITIINRRMKRESDLRQARSVAGQKGMRQRWHNKGDNTNDNECVTPLENEYVNVNENVNEYSLEEVKDACIVNGIPESNAQVYYDHFNAQGWLRANSLPITSLRSHIAAMWSKQRACWVFGESSQEKKAVDMGKYCYRCGESHDPYTGKKSIVWHEGKPWCGWRDCYKKWVKEGRPK